MSDMKSNFTALIIKTKYSRRCRRSTRTEINAEILYVILALKDKIESGDLQGFFIF